AYNICSGKGISLKDIIAIIAKQVGIEVTTKTNMEFIRPRDNQVIIGSSFKIESELGWHPEISIQETIHDMIQYQEKI
ncbi:MAG: GDP-mannose 4,6-dehydratase, partial [Eubacterium sp.]|nr:GDP-mannose 4,6-dehydratase [Eubacterium sp.]